MCRVSLQVQMCSVMHVAVTACDYGGERSTAGELAAANEQQIMYKSRGTHEESTGFWEMALDVQKADLRADNAAPCHANANTQSASHNRNLVSIMLQRGMPQSAGNAARNGHGVTIAGQVRRLREALGSR